jgi:hypothetical protein
MYRPAGIIGTSHIIRAQPAWSLAKERIQPSLSMSRVRPSSQEKLGILQDFHGRDCFMILTYLISDDQSTVQFRLVPKGELSLEGLVGNA